MEHCTLVYDNSNKLGDINRDEEPILVVSLVYRVRCLTALGERDMPPEIKQDGVSSGSLEPTITKGCEYWHPRYDVSDRSFPHNVQFKVKLFAKEFNLLVHRLVAIILELCVMNQMGSFLPLKVYVLYLVLC